MRKAREQSKLLKKGGAMALIPKPTDDDLERGVNIQLTNRMWRELDEIAKHETEVDPPVDRKKYTRLDIIRFFLQHGITEYWASRGGRPAPKARKDNGK